MRSMRFLGLLALAAVLAATGGACSGQPAARAVSCKTVSPSGECVVGEPLYPADPSGIAPVEDMVVESGNVYWTSGRYGRVMAVSVDGGAPVTLTTGPTQPWGITASPTTVYWTELNQNFVDNNAVYQAAVDGGPPVLVVPMAENPVSIALDSTGLYWSQSADDGVLGGVAVSGKILRIPLGGGSVVTLASSQSSPSSLAVNGSSVFWIDAFGPGVPPPNGVISSVALGGGVVTTIASGFNAPTGAPPRFLAADASRAYWISPDSAAMGTEVHDGSIKATLIGSNTIDLLASGQNEPAALAIDSSFVYWVNLSGTVMKVALGGGSLSTLADGQPGPGAIAVDATSVYWGNYDGSIVKLTPK